MFESGDSVEWQIGLHVEFPTSEQLFGPQTFSKSTPCSLFWTPLIVNRLNNGSDPIRVALSRLSCVLLPTETYSKSKCTDLGIESPLFVYVTHNCCIVCFD